MKTLSAYDGYIGLIFLVLLTVFFRFANTYPELFTSESRQYFQVIIWSICYPFSVAFALSGIRLKTSKSSIAGAISLFLALPFLMLVPVGTLGD